jgi:hypothetical protein
VWRRNQRLLPLPIRQLDYPGTNTRKFIILEDFTRQPIAVARADHQPPKADLMRHYVADAA